MSGQLGGDYPAKQTKVKEMKTVFKSNEIAHVWVNQGAPHGRCPSSMSFDGDVFRSYGLSPDFQAGRVARTERQK